MKNPILYELDAEEQKLVGAVERGEWVSSPDAEQIKKDLTAAARQSGSKVRNINIRISERDLYKLKAKAVHEGIPYQTLASSILHKNAL